MSEPRWLTPEQLRAWKKLIAVVELLPGALESQLQRDSGLSHFEYFTLAMLSEAPERTLRMTSLAAQTNATLARLSHVVSRLEKRGLVRREACAEDRRATNAILTPAGWTTVEAAAPGHVGTVLRTVIDPLSDADVADLDRIAGRILEVLDPSHVMVGVPATDD
ncbi:MarR family transcriptional regulator [uncultured Cellulomonas sp.]|uniref:MarR family winged helix-turn-helix transcriptional regulator n=1 Tax=uncultured Cellulomonas sp. TaxID=189682 RepID=UPI0028EEC3B6|nr:MarR family transcriptional regulator [uncultured Cellulomonas sp.]